MDFEKVFKESEEFTASEKPEVEETVQENKVESTEESPKSNYIWKVEALGEDEVRSLFNNIRNGDSRLDREFVDKVYEVFPDMPHAVMILRGEDAYIDADESEEFNEEMVKLFNGELYYSNGEESGVCNLDTLWDYVGDGKNPLEVYAATYSRSDGMENTVIFVYGNGWFKICKITDEVKEAILNYIFEVEGGEKVVDECFRKEFDKSIFLNNVSLI